MTGATIALAGVRWAAGAVRWMLAPWVDHWRGLSLTRILATALAATSVYVSVATRAIGAGAVTLAIFAVATAFGRSVFTAALARYQATDTRSDTTTSNTAELIKAARDAVKGFQATP